MTYIFNIILVYETCEHAKKTLVMVEMAFNGSLAPIWLKHLATYTFSTSIFPFQKKRFHKIC
jgi:hypothetical protein